jgi:hypothetical protein
MDENHPLLLRLFQFDGTAIADLERLAATAPQLCFDIGWAFVTRVADIAPHVSAGFVDGALLSMQKALGWSYVEERLISSWSTLGEETRGELCDSGIANPRVFSNDFCERLFFLPDASLMDRRWILGALASTLAQRGFSKDRLEKMLATLEKHESAQRDGELQKFIRHIRTGFLQGR